MKPGVVTCWASAEQVSEVDDSARLVQLGEQATSVVPGRVVAEVCIYQAAGIVQLILQGGPGQLDNFASVLPGEEVAGVHLEEPEKNAIECARPQSV